MCIMGSLHNLICRFRLPSTCPNPAFSIYIHDKLQKSQAWTLAITSCKSHVFETCTRRQSEPLPNLNLYPGMFLKLPNLDLQRLESSWCQSGSYREVDLIQSLNHKCYHKCYHQLYHNCYHKMDLGENRFRERNKAPEAGKAGLRFRRV